jgi:hypothetical protein
MERRGRYVKHTTAKSDGNYEIWFDVPEATKGTHYVWVKAGGDLYSAAFTVDEQVKAKPDSGLGDDDVDVSAYGLAGDKDVALVMVDTAGIANWNWVPVAPAAVTLDAGETEYSGNLVGLVEPGTVVITDTVETFTDNADGTLTGSVTGTGKINYVTGEWEVDFSAAPTIAPTVAYSVFTEAADVAEELATTGSTNDLGSYSKEVTIPDWTQAGYFIESLDAKGNSGSDAFTIGASISAPDSADVGDVIEISGRGFLGDDVDYADGVTVGGLPAVIEGGDHVVVNGDDEFTLDLIVPQVPDEDEDYVISISDGTSTATVEIEINALATITITPDYGPQGSTVSIEGEHFPNIKEEELGLELGPGWAGAPFETFETESDGSFSGTFRIPAEVDGTYEMNVFWDSPRGETVISATDDFRIGSILILLSDDEGPTGKDLILSGNGFTANKGWNATFGDIAIFSEETVDGNGLLKDGGGAAMFYVPQVEPGVYPITVLDEDTGIEVMREFTVTETTTFTIDPVEAPAGYNVTFEGMYWSEDQTPTFEFWVYNDTDEWDITDDVYKMQQAGWNDFMTGDADGSDADDGAFMAWWFIGDEDPTDAVDVFEMGEYWLNVTYGDDWLYQTSFTVGPPHVEISPRKSTFRIGDTVSFSIEHSFGNNAAADILGGMVDIIDPDGDLYFRTDALNTWVKSGMYYYVPTPQQVDNLNPMVLLDDAPLGEWSYEWYENDGDTVIATGTFMVDASQEDLVSGQIADLSDSLADLSGQVGDVQDEFDTLSSEIADVASVAADAVAAAEAASDAVTAVAATANTASEAAANAADAANAAKDAANGLTTLVYGAIGAALVAALAAIVSLMQISRRIAG